MKPPNGKVHSLFLILVVSVAVLTANAQDSYSNYQYRVDLTGATEAPELGPMPSVGIPEEARKQGVEGVLIAEMTLGTFGKVTDYVFKQTLPHGFESAVKSAFDTFNFKPAKNNGKPVPIKMQVELTVTMLFDEKDKAISKPKITAMPEAVYPEGEIHTNRKGEVAVLMIFEKSGTAKVVSVGSTMPRVFDAAAVEAAKKLEFQPGTHKKSKMPVSVKMQIVYKFKP